MYSHDCHVKFHSNSYHKLVNNTSGTFNPAIYFFQPPDSQALTAVPDIFRDEEPTDLGPYADAPNDNEAVLIRHGLDIQFKNVIIWHHENQEAVLLEVNLLNAAVPKFLLTQPPGLCNILQMNMVINIPGCDSKASILYILGEQDRPDILTMSINSLHQDMKQTQKPAGRNTRRGKGTNQKMYKNFILKLSIVHCKK